MYQKIISVFLLCGFVVLINGIVTQDKPTAKTHLSPHIHHTKNTSPHYRQSPQKCDLVCPGRPPLALPPNFMQNCTKPNTSNNSTQSNGNSTTSKPSTTTESSEGGEETDESTEASAEASTTKKTTGAKKASMKHQKPKNINNHSQLKKNSQNKQHHQHQNKKHLKKEKVLLKHEAKQKLFKHSKHFNEKARLDGCYVVCSEGNGNPINGNQDGSEETDTEESGSEESGDHYVPGEDTAVEIIYVPGRTKENQRPFEMYQTNYAFLEPEPVFGYGYDPFFIEGKRKKIKKRKQISRKTTDKTQENH